MTKPNGPQWQFLYSPPPRYDSHTVIAFPPGTEPSLDNESDVGIMQWGDQGGKITELYVGKDFRRQGVATGMMEHARRIAKENPNVPEPQHNQFRSRAGDAWARKVGGDVPPLDKGGFMPYED